MNTLFSTLALTTKTTNKVNIGDIIMIKGESKNGGYQKIGKLSHLFTRKEKLVRAVQMQVGTNFLVQPIQLLYQLEVHCHVQARQMKEQKETNLNAYANEFGPKRNTAVITDARH